MEISLVNFLIVCPFCFIAGIMNASGGCGGLISLPAMLIAGLPAHLAVGTNKVQSTMGLAVANYRFIRSHLLDFRLAVPCIAVAVVGSLIGSNLSIHVPEQILTCAAFVVVPFATWAALRRGTFVEDTDTKPQLSRRSFVITACIAFVIGAYDGLYGPGTGTFLILAFTAIVGLPVRAAGAQGKAINFATNVTALTVFLIHGEVIVVLGLAAGVCNMVGSWIGASLIIQDGTKIMKPAIIVALALLVLRLSGVY